MTQPISADQPLSTRIERVGEGVRVYVDSAWFRYFVDVGEVDLTEDVIGILPVANGGTGVATMTPTVTLITAFLNGWVNFNTATWSPAGYYVDLFGFVHLQGNIKNGTIGLEAFVLPPALWPAKRKGFAVMGATPPCRVDVQEDGSVIPQLGTNGFQSLEGITFLPGS
jgi:hypothetical protein